MVISGPILEAKGVRCSPLISTIMVCSVGYFGRRAVSKQLGWGEYDNQKRERLMPVSPYNKESSGQGESGQEDWLYDLYEGWGEVTWVTDIGLLGLYLGLFWTLYHFGLVRALA